MSGREEFETSNAHALQLVGQTRTASWLVNKSTHSRQADWLLASFGIHCSRFQCPLWIRRGSHTFTR